MPKSRTSGTKARSDCYGLVQDKCTRDVGCTWVKETKTKKGSVRKPHCSTVPRYRYKVAGSIDQAVERTRQEQPY